MAIPEAPETSTLSTSTSAGSVDSGAGRVTDSITGKSIPSKTSGSGSSGTFITFQSTQSQRNTIPSNPAIHAKILGKLLFILSAFIWIHLFNSLGYTFQNELQ